MARVVNHQQIYKPGIFGGITNRTLCGRVSSAGEDMNVSGTDATADVTCKMCVRLITDGRSPLLKYIGWKPSE